MTSFGETLKACRVAKKLTLRELHQRMGLSVSYLSDIENNRKNPPNLEQVRKIEDVLGIKDNLLINLAAQMKRASEDLRETMRIRPQLLALLLRASKCSDETVESLLKSLEERENL